MKLLSAGVLALIAFVLPQHAQAASHTGRVVRMQIVTPTYTLTCVPQKQKAHVILDCLTRQTPRMVARSAFQTWRYGDPMPYAILAQVAPTSTGGPPLCDGATIICQNTLPSINLAHANTWSATQTFSSIIDTALGTTAGSTVCIDNTGQLTVSGCAGGGGASTSTSNVWTNFNAYTYVPTTGCTTNAPTAPVCIGSPTSTAALAIGKTTGGWGGTTVSGSGLLCFVVNGGTSDSPCTTAGTAVAGGSNGDLNLYSSHNVVVNTKLVATNLDANGSNVQDFRHIGSLVTCSGTGTFTNANSNDSACLITLASGAAVMTFKTAWTAAPVCVASDTTAANAVKVTATTTTLTLAGTSADVIMVLCMGNGSV